MLIKHAPLPVALVVRPGDRQVKPGQNSSRDGDGLALRSLAVAADWLMSQKPAPPPGPSCPRAIE
ncbi:hypothetical protein, partial [Rhodoferax sp.]|uniref:hypothetical protein n=1 Tax=Rhodoferax sp. TaxID=50421 RepID=UPI00374D4AEE